jgi:alkyl hydroperoxide reductase subunit AhpC
MMPAVALAVILSLGGSWMTIDRDGSISRLYGAARFGGSFLPVKRVTFVIDKKGIIRKVAHHELAVGKHIDAITGCLRALAEEDRKE